jgi:hypothetical protein
MKNIHPKDVRPGNLYQITYSNHDQRGKKEVVEIFIAIGIPREIQYDPGWYRIPFIANDKKSYYTVAYNTCTILDLE